MDGTVPTDLVSALQRGGTLKTVTATDDVSYSNVPAYSTVYGIHPRLAHTLTHSLASQVWLCSSDMQSLLTLRLANWLPIIDSPF